MDSLLQKFAITNEDNLIDETPKSFSTRFGRDVNSSNNTDENPEEMLNSSRNLLIRWLDSGLSKFAK